MRWLDRQLFPWHLFEDVGAAAGPKAQRSAYAANRQRRGLLLPYLNSWIQFCVLLLLGMRAPELLGAANPEKSYIQAAIAIAFSFAFVASAVMSVCYFFLRFVEE